MVNPLTAFVALLVSGSLGAVSVAARKAENHTCAALPRYYSCESPVLGALNKGYDKCCTPTEGLVLITQFWNTHTGLETNGSRLPKEAWGVHGLWPDRCDGTYGQYCDLARQYDPRPSPNTTTGLPNGTVVPVWTEGDMTTPLLKRLGKYDLLAFMNARWKSYRYPDWDLWQHEFSKHATCFSTYDVGNNGTADCYGPSYANATEQSVVEYYENTVQAEIQYPTYQWLANASIVPSNSTGYNLSTIEGALTKASGAIPYVGCSGATRQTLTEVWYYTHTLGRPQEAIFKPVNQTTTSNCNKTAPVWYYTRSNGSEAKEVFKLF